MKAKDFEEITFTIYGKPQSAGSKRAFVLRRKGGAIVTRPNGQPIVNVTDDNPKSRDWKEAVASAAREVYGGDLLRGPIALKLVFYRVRPGGHFSKATGQLNKEGRETPCPIAKPDVLKLARAVEDALTGVVWADDAQIVEEGLSKRWGEPARVEVSVRELAGEAIHERQLSLGVG